MPDNLFFEYFLRGANAFVIFVAFFLGMFLYWREGRRELVDNRTLFDVVAVFLAGAFVMGRLVDFVVRVDFYNWSIVRLIFFNTYWGFDIFGAFLGSMLFLWIYLRGKKEHFWEIFDFAASGIAFALFVYLAGMAVVATVGRGNIDYLGIVWSMSFLVLFWIIKRLEKQKKFKGFFTNLFMVGATLINLSLFVVNFGFDLKRYWWIFGVNLALFFVSSILLYVLSERKLVADIKSIFGFILLSIFKSKRTLTNIREADNSAKVIVLSPLYLVRGVYFLVKYVGREIYSSLVDLRRAFGIGK